MPPGTDLETACALALAVHAPDHLFVHAGAVRLGGRVLALPGASWSGKSTLVQALVERGAVFYSDEYLVLNEDGMVVPFPRALSLRSPQARRVPAGELGWNPDLSPSPPGWVVDCHYTGFRQLQSMGAGETFLSLFRHAVAARRRAGDLLQSLAPRLNQVPGLRGTRGDAAETADWLLEWTSRSL